MTWTNSDTALLNRLVVAVERIARALENQNTPAPRASAEPQTTKLEQ